MKPTYLALHCSASGPAQWDWYRDPSARGASWIAPALMGYGENGWRAGMPLMLEDEVWRLLPHLRKAGRPLHLVGHSYGGAVALKAASLWPEYVDSVTVYEPVLFHLLRDDPWSAAHAQEIAAVAADVARCVRARDLRAAAQRFVDYWSGAGVWAGMPAARQAQIAASMPKVRAEFGALLHGRLDLAALEQVPQVRILTGTASPAPVRRIVDLLLWQLPSAAVVQVPGADHMAPLTQPHRISEALFPRVMQDWALAA